MTMHNNRWLVLTAVMLAFVPIVIDMTILHIAVPSLTLALGASGSEILWIIDIYPLVMAGLLVPMGTLADRVGHRKMLLTGLAVFLIASVIAAFAPTAAILIGARLLLAVGASMVMPNILAIIRQTFEDDNERAMALGLWGTVGAAGAAFGPLVGGLLLEHFWWGSVFLINVPVMAIVWPLAYFAVPKNQPQGTGHWKIGQAIALIIGLIASVYALKSAFKQDAVLLNNLVIAIVGLGLIAWFVRQQLRSPAPMLDMSLFKTPAIVAGVVMALVVTGSLAGVELTIAQELQFVVGRTPLEAGLFMMPLVAASAIGGPIAGYLVKFISLKWLSPASLISAAVALYFLGLSDFHAPGLPVYALMAVLGLALSIGLTASSIAIMSSAPVEKAGAAGSLEGTGYELGAGLGISMFGVLLTHMYSSHLRMPEQLQDVVPANARDSIGETILAAQNLGADRALLEAAASQAFSSAHQVVLISAAVLIGVLGVGVGIALRNYRAASASAH